MDRAQGFSYNFSQCFSTFSDHEAVNVHVQFIYNTKMLRNFIKANVDAINFHKFHRMKHLAVPLFVCLFVFLEC